MTRTDDTATAHQAWDETWKSETGRANWLVPQGEVMDVAGALHVGGAYDALDLGCGIGRHALALARMGYRVAALDASPAGLEELGRTATADGLEVRIHQAPMTGLPFADGTFDYVVSWNVIHHGAPEVVARAIAEIERVLRPGGTYQGTMLTKRNMFFGIGREIAPDTWFDPAAVGDKAHPHFYCDAEVVHRLFSGFEVLRLDETDLGKPARWHWHMVARKHGHPA